MKGHRHECAVIDGKSDLCGKSSSPQAVLAQYQHRESCDFSGEPMAVALESNTFVGAQWLSDPQSTKVRNTQRCIVSEVTRCQPFRGRAPSNAHMSLRKCRCRLSVIHGF